MQPFPLIRDMITLPEGSHLIQMQVLFSVEEQEVSAFPGPASRCLRGRGYDVRWWGEMERRGRLRDRDFRTIQWACSQSRRRTSVATLEAARWNRRPTRGGGSVVRLRGRQWRL
jgi:hypothetical protein